MEAETHVDHGALVGWKGQNLGERIVLTMQSVTTPPPHERGDVNDFLFMLDRQQAVQLGYFLFKITGETPPPKRKRGVLDKLLGG